MTPIVFDAQLLQDWAAFSGDRNPVHFDADLAWQLLGTERTIAHGMLAMLPLKNAMARALPTTDGADCWRWEALLRRPVLCDTAYTVQTNFRPNDNTLSTNLECLNAATRHITSRTAPVAPNSRFYGAPGRYPLDAGYVDAQHRKFGAAFPAFATPWIFYDALLFSHYLESHLLGLLASMNIEIRYPNDLMAQDLTILQISHAVTATSTTFRSADPVAADTLRYSIAPPCITGTGETRYATIQTTLYDDQRPLLAQELSLLIQPRRPVAQQAH